MHYVLIIWILLKVLSIIMVVNEIFNIMKKACKKYDKPIINREIFWLVLAGIIYSGADILFIYLAIV